MWAINLSLGSCVAQHLENDYEDAEAYRDCLYYECSAVWTRPSLNLSDGIMAPFGLSELSESFIRENLPRAVNKLTHSNFVDQRFISDMQFLAELFPEPLRHVYLASGLSEAVDKVVKVLWLNRQPRKRLVCFEGHYFGETTALTRSLSQIGEALFDVHVMKAPFDQADSRVVVELQTALRRDDVLAVFVEPLLTRSLQATNKSLLARIRKLCSVCGVPLVYNETASLFYRFSQTGFAASSDAEILPDAAIAGLGHQLAAAFVKREWFVAEPLKLISTWDGDAIALAKFVATARAVTSNPDMFFQLRSEFTAALARCVSRAGSESSIQNGAGLIRGSLPEHMIRMLSRNADGSWRVCPSVWAMREYLREHSATA
jgi:acetylornithine/succinyldiaminopimelate/putrescine aminotransferase